MQRPPMSKFFSTMMTEAPFSRAAIAATRPPAPPPMTTTSASRSQRIASAASAGCDDIAPTATAPAAAPEVRKSRRLSGGVASLALRGDLDTAVSSQNRWLQVRIVAPGGQFRAGLRPAQVLTAQGQRTGALAGRHVDRVADRGRDQRHGLLADPRNPAVRFDVV